MPESKGHHPLWKTSVLPRDAGRGYSLAMASSFVTVFQLRAVAVTPRRRSVRRAANRDRWIPFGCQA